MNNLPLAVVLAGGLSRRMDHVEKSLIQLDGKPLIAHVIERIEPQVSKIIINANGDPARFSSFKLDVVKDIIEGYAGPLAGVLSAMRWAQNNMPDITNIITAASDTPFFPTDLVSTMVEAQSDTQKPIIANSNDRRHPVFALWPVSLADDLEDFLQDENNRKVMFFAKAHDPIDVNFEATPTHDPFFNINTAEDLIQAETIISQVGKS